MSKKNILYIIAAIPLSCLIAYFLFGISEQILPQDKITSQEVASSTNTNETEEIVPSNKTRLVIKKATKNNVKGTPETKTSSKKEETVTPSTQNETNGFNVLPSTISEEVVSDEDAFSNYPTQNGQHYIGFVNPQLIQKFDPATLQDFRYVQDELLVGVKADFNEETIRQTLGNVEIRPFEKLPGAYHVILGKNADLAGIIAQLNQNSAIDYAEPNFLKEASAVPSDPYFSYQYSHTIAKSTTAWDISTGSSSVIVAVIDTGVQTSHPDLAANIFVNSAEASGVAGVDDDANGYIDDVSGWDFFAGDSIPNDVVGHGTHCAGIIGAKGSNGVGLTGVAWSVSILPCRIGAGEGLSISAAISAIVYSADMGAKVLSNSWGGPGYSSALASAISYSNGKGCMFITASGNDSKNNDVYPSYPANYPIANVISVASSTSSDTMSSFSNYGVGTVHLAAPGSDIASTYPTSAYSYLSGTSMACPFVSGAMALLYSTSPSLSVTEAKSKLMSGVDVLPAFTGKTISGGRINVTKLLAGTSGGTTPPPGGGTTTPPPGGGTTTPPPSGSTSAFLLLGTGDGGTNTLIKSDLAGGSASMEVFGSDNTGGEVLVAGGDVHSASGIEMVVAHGDGGVSKVSVLSATGTVLSSFTAFSTSENPSGKVNIHVAEISTGSSGKEIICGTGPSGASKVKIYSGTGSLLSSFTVSGNAGGELYVAGGDLLSTSSGPEILVGSGVGGPSSIACFSAAGSLIFSSSPLTIAGTPITVGIGDVHATSGTEMMFSFGNVVYVYNFTASTYVATFYGFSTSANPSGKINLAVGDLLSGVAGSEIYVGSGAGGSSEAKIYSGTGSMVAVSKIFTTNPGGEVHVGAMK